MNACAIDDARRLRRTLGACPTGVGIVTAYAPDGRPVGLTVNSFVSLSLEPPLLSWSLSHRSRLMPVFRAAGHFAINLLSDRQEALARRFAAADVPDRFGGVALRPGESPAPLLDGALAHFVCASTDRVEAGDHTMFIGRIESHHRADGAAPLVFHAGDFVRLAA